MGKLEFLYPDDLITFSLGYLEIEYECAVNEILIDQLFELAYSMYASEVEIEQLGSAAAEMRYSRAMAYAHTAIYHVYQIANILKPLLNRILGPGFLEGRTITAAFIQGADLVLRYDEYPNGVPVCATWAHRN